MLSGPSSTKEKEEDLEFILDLTFDLAFANWA
jgi:hypothetical protein